MSSQTPQVSQVQTQAKELTQEELRNIIEKALNSPIESQYILVLQTFKSEYSPQWYYKTYEVLLGKVNEIRLNREKVALIPQTIPVIVKYVESLPDYYGIKVYVFTERGWTEVDVTAY